MRKTHGCIALSIMLLGACNVGDDIAPESVARSDEELTGGRVALESEFPATIYNGCTSSKVGPRHFLIAAHCVYNSGTGTVTLPPGSAFYVNPNNDSTVPGRYVSVAQTYVHPDWIAGGGSALHPSYPGDVALVVVNEDTPEVREAAIDSSTVTPGQSVVLAGYGCENGLGYPSGPPRLKIQEVPALAASALLHPDSWVSTPEQANDVAASNVITPGLFLDPEAASLCYGDSGGPLFRENSSEQLVVGTAAYYSFSPNSDGISTTNWHARVDAGSRYGVFSWLQSLGVTVRTAGPCTDGIKNGPEPATDCGASCIATCGDGLACRTDSDCSSQNCNGGVCQAPRPCSGLCSNPTVISSLPFNSGSLGTGASCYESTTNIEDALCGSMNGRAFEINGQGMSCSSPFVPALRNGGYCISTDAGQPSWSWFSVW